MKRVMYLTTEAVPLAKTGGLADVCGALPPALDAMQHGGHDYRAEIMMPAFSSVHRCGLSIQTTDISLAIEMRPGELVGARLLKTHLPSARDRRSPGVTVWLIDQPQYFGRDGLYGPPGGAYPDNAERFIFFCRAAISIMMRLSAPHGQATNPSAAAHLSPLIDRPIDIIHCNDWQTSLVPALIRSDRSAAGHFSETKSVLTIHNLAYQGHFSSEDFPLTGLPWTDFRSDLFEYYNGMNFLKTGLVTADALTTVSQRYAEEICTPQFGCGMETILRDRQGTLSGIVNGIDPVIWNPSTDPHLVKNYDVDNWIQGKAENKVALQKEFGLPENPDAAMIGLVGRLAEQKGWDLILPVITDHLTQLRPVQWVVLGSGDVNYQEQLTTLMSDYSDRFGLKIGFSEQLAHRIEASADLFLMPSHYEPCGLNQLYSLRYGALPIVNPVGGLADTVVDATDRTIKDETATGFYLPQATSRGLDNAIGRALSIRYHRRDDWNRMVRTGMLQDWSWIRSAQQYAKLYQSLSGQPADSTDDGEDKVSANDKVPANDEVPANDKVSASDQDSAGDAKPPKIKKSGKKSKSSAKKH